MSINATTSSTAWMTARPVPTAAAKSVRDLLGANDRAQRLIDSVVQVDASRRDSVEGYTSKLSGEQKTLQTLTSLVERLPPSTSQKERDAWNAQLAEARDAVTDSTSQIAHFQSQIDSDPARDRTLKFAGGLLGMSTEDIHKIYTERTQAYEAAQDAAQAAGAAADGANTTGGATEWGSEKSGLRAEIKVDGVTVGRVYNGGGVELSDDYGSLGLELGFGAPLEGNREGPDLADWRIAKLTEAFKNAQVEIVKAPTVQTQAEWLASKSSITADHAPVDRTV